MMKNNTREAFNALCKECGTDPQAEETAILSVGREFLPACAVAVLDGAEPTEEYWVFLSEQTTEAQDEHDREAAAGREWAQ